MTAYQLLPPLRDVELNELRSSIERFGVKAPVHVDENDEILDGHHRVMIADSLGLPYQTIKCIGLSDHEKRILAAELNVARRQLTDAQKVQLGRQIEPDIRAVAAASQGTRTDLPTSATTVTKVERTTDAVAQKVGLGSGRTYERGKALLEEVEQEPDADELLERIESGAIDLPDVRQELRDRRPHVANNSGENEWYTPPQFTAAARQVMGGIDIDPASCAKANETVHAYHYFDAEVDGLKQFWSGRVYLNPPYAQPFIQQFCEKLVWHVGEGEVEQAIVLVNNATETGWFQHLLTRAAAMAFPKGRIKYLDASGRPAGAPLQGQAFVYFGPRDKALQFVSVFREFGAASLWGAE